MHPNKDGRSRVVWAVEERLPTLSRNCFSLLKTRPLPVTHITSHTHTAAFRLTNLVNIHKQCARYISCYSQCEVVDGKLDDSNLRARGAFQHPHLSIPRDDSQSSMECSEVASILLSNEMVLRLYTAVDSHVQ